MPRFPSSARITAIETGLRRDGLPFFVAPARRSSLLVARTTPFVVAVFYVDVARWLGTHAPLTVDDSAAGLLLGALAVAAMWVGVPVGAFLLTARLGREQPRRMTVVGAVLLGGFVVLEPSLEASGWPAAVLADTALVAGALLTTWSGLGAIVGWAARTSVRRVRALGLVATRAVPLLMLVVIFAFFSRSLWQVTGSLPASRLLAVTVFFVGLDLLVIVPLTRSEFALEARGPGEPQQVNYAHEPGAGFGPPLSRLERANLMLVLILAQCFQTFVFFSLVCGFLVVLGAIVFSGGVLADWSGTQPALFTVAGVTLPFDVTLLKTAVFLSCVASLNFLVTASNQAAYKSAFYDPLFASARAALAVRSAYLAEPETARNTEV